MSKLLMLLAARLEAFRGGTTPSNRAASCLAGGAKSSDSTPAPVTPAPLTPPRGAFKVSSPANPNVI